MVKTWKKLGTILASYCLLVSCAGFSYHYYGLDQVSYDHGVLLGPTPHDDIPFSKCSPRECVVMFAKDFFAFKQDYQDSKNKLIECEKK